MNSATTSSFQNNVNCLTKNKNKGPLRTSNLQVFPSLHPLHGLYGQKRPEVPSTSSVVQKEDKNIMKKVKTDVGSHNAVKNMGCKIEKPIMRIEIRNKVRNQASDDEIFKVPRLPKRLLKMKEQAVEETKQEQLVIKLEEEESPVKEEGSPVEEESLVMPSTVNQSLNQIEMSLLTALRAAYMANNNYAAQNWGLCSQEFNSLALNAIYQNFKIAYLNSQMQQNL